MKTIVAVLMLIALLAAPALAGPVTKQDFQVQTTQNLINLCTAAKDDPLHNHARNFCHGYLVGAFHYYLEAHDGPKATKLVCFAKKRPSRNQAVKMFVDWAQAHPQYMKERPVETEFRFLMATWPCPSQAAR
jgi:hypothetical protein